ncbi:baseplate hub protein [Serratia proteamaculans]
MSQNWMRHFELLLTDDNGLGISLNDFKVTFNIEWTNTMWPRVATLKVYNLSKDTNSRILGSEFSKVKMIAGYDGLAAQVSSSQVGVVRNVDASKVGQTDGQNFGEIFNGEIRFTVTGRDNPTDTYILIQAIDGHQAFDSAMVNITLAAGYTAVDVHAATMKGFNAFGVTQGLTSDMPPTVYPRGRVLFKSARDVMKNLAATCNADWQIIDGQVQMVSTDKFLREAIILNSDTGLIGMPQQTMGAGVNVRCLINPNIRVGGLIELDQASAYRIGLTNEDLLAVKYDENGNIISSPKLGEAAVNGNQVVSEAKSQPASIATDGVYIVQSISYSGDTRGQAWYMDLMCFARGAKELYSQSTLQRVQV